MNLGGGRGKLYAALKNLRLRWEATSDVWQDAVRKQFETDTWEPIEAHAAAALRGIDNLSQVLTQMRHECEGREW